MDFFTPEFFSNVGFPAAICLYTVFGIKPTLDKLTVAIEKLTTDIDKRGEKQTQEITCLRDEVKELKYKVSFIQNKYSEVSKK